MDQYIALSKKDMKISITLNEIYSTHALLAKHVDQMVPSQIGLANLEFGQRRSSVDITQRPWQRSKSAPPQRKHYH